MSFLFSSSEYGGDGREDNDFNSDQSATMKKHLFVPPDGAAQNVVCQQRCANGRDKRT
jgi:hypothetical protein